jgi:hypothetical protein
MHACNPNYPRSRGRKTTNSRPAQENIERPYLKNKIKDKGAKSMVQLVESLPNKCQYWVQAPVLRNTQTYTRTHTYRKKEKV